MSSQRKRALEIFARMEAEVAEANRLVAENSALTERRKAAATVEERRIIDESQRRIIDAIQATMKRHQTLHDELDGELGFDSRLAKLRANGEPE